MFKLICTDADGRSLEVRHFTLKPTEDQENMFFFEMVAKFQTFIYIKVERMKYADL